MKALIFEKYGPPAETLQLRDAPKPTPASGEVLVKMAMSPINPSDLMSIEGRYGRKPPLPATPGFEGTGVIEESRGGMLASFMGRKPGKRVAVLNRTSGNWQEYVVIPWKQAIPIPDDIPNEQSASFFVNPATALVMVRHVLNVPAGAWMLQTAAGSALGTMIIRLGKHLGFKTINLVRRQEQVAELKKLGADEVLVMASKERETGLTDKILALTEGGVRYAVDPVGGAMGEQAALALGAGGTLLLYGTLTDDPIPLNPRTLMVGHKKIQGFWLTEWAKEQGALRMIRLFSEITDMMRKGLVTSPVQATYGLEQYREAMTAAQKPGRSGKILLKIS